MKVDVVQLQPCSSSGYPVMGLPDSWPDSHRHKEKVVGFFVCFFTPKKILGLIVMKQMSLKFTQRPPELIFVQYLGVRLERKSN